MYNRLFNHERIALYENRLSGCIRLVKNLTKLVKIGDNFYIFPFIDEHRKNLILKTENEIIKIQEALTILKSKN